MLAKFGLVGVIDQNDLTDLLSPNGLAGLISHIEQNSLFGLVGLDGIIRNNSFGGLSLVGFSYFVNLISLSGIGSIRGFGGLSLVGYIGIIYPDGYICIIYLVGFIDLVLNRLVDSSTYHCFAIILL